ncbi:putative antiviral protein [Tothia fuscella]|uniref:Antiviral protein n=1 Tax=Tothia fuscella TaxID=1048955 RepID=A0A9P4NM05_9PEZI|nr:putative antiviral protein [Tothia fuscella]
MSSVKGALKAAKAALDAQKYDDAITQAQTVLSLDSKNYFANLFLGRAFDKQGKPVDAAKAYNAATKIKPDEDQAWQGLRILYEGQGGKSVDDYITVSVRLAEIYADAEQLDKCSLVVDKLMAYVKANGTQTQYKRALAVHLPTSSIYPFLEGRLQHPSLTYTRLAEITEAEEKERVNTLIAERRTRLGARKEQVTADVKREVYGKSDLEGLYQNVIDWTSDHEVRRDYEERLLKRAYDTLVVVPTEEKKEKREQVAKLARGFVLIKHPYPLAWDIHLEWSDVESIGELDVGVLREYVEFFPDKGVAKVLKGYLSSDISPFPKPPPPPPPADDISDDDVGGGVSLSPTTWSAEDRLILMTDGLADAKSSVLAHRLLSEYYFHLEEFESVVETIRSGLKALSAESRQSGLKLQNDLDAMNTMLGTALVRYQSPRHHAEAKTLFNDILKRKPQFTPALIGVGLVLEEEEEYKQAIDYLTQALERDPTNTRVGVEAAWCRALNGDLEGGLKELERLLEKIEPEERDLRSETLYRIGKCQWDLDPLRANRKDRQGPYARFLASIRSNINYAPAYTMLGIYYADYAKDKKRARQCFQKAFELSPSEVEAAERLARSFADQGDWDIVEIIAQRVVESGKTRPPPGSKKKGFSWPYSALGVVQMNKQEYQQGIVSFLAALRISPDDYHSYVGLGESYHNSGRYNSAARTFNYAENPEDGVKVKKSGESWFTKYMLANVNRELGAYDDAITGYKAVLESKKQEFGVEIALLQTYLERAWHCIDTGFFGGAVDSAQQALNIASGIVEYLPQAFNLWKGVADACALYSVVQGKLATLPASQIKDLLENSFDLENYELFADVDGIGKRSLMFLTSADSSLSICITASILAQKRAISSCAHDIHAQAVSWYNLGWTEYRAHTCLEQPSSASDTNSKTKPLTKFLKASMRCFKRAIELEAGNPEFWNALGVVTTQLNPKVAQHALVRSLHLNERNVKAWTNLGVLYLLQKDHELAHQAFARAQSTDPDYAHAWLGEGLVALLWGDVKEALVHFTHAFEIGESGSSVVKKEYAAHAFDHLLAHPSALGNMLNLIQPIFALQQLHALTADDAPFEHLSALFNERIGDYESAGETLRKLCDKLEAEFEETESNTTMARFAHAKADLARNHLAAHDYTSAAEEASTALDLTSDTDETPMLAEIRHKIRLSARLTLGLANYYLQNMDDALLAFRKALEESDASPDVVCLLAEVLWAKGGENERAVAKEQLFECVERVPGHVGCVVLLGVMATLDDDDETIDAVRDELEGLRVNSSVSERDLIRVERVLEGMALLSTSTSSSSPSSPDANATLTDAQNSIALHPWKANGWMKLGREVDDGFPKDMALKTAEGNVPPRVGLGAEGLAKALAGTGRVGDAMRGVMVAPCYEYP